MTQEKGIIIYDSHIPGSTTVIMSGVHGNEKGGILAMQKCEKSLVIVAGKVIFIYANLLAIEQNMRFIEVNMNRCFGITHVNECYETIRAKEIEKYLAQADLLLDLHNTIATNSIPFLISEHSQYNKFFDVKYVILGLDVWHPGGSDGYMNSINKQGVCLESGNLSDTESEDRASEAIQNILIAKGHIAGDITLYSQEQSKIHVYTTCRNSSMNILFPEERQDFTLIKKGDVVYYDDGKAYTAERDSYILFKKEPTIVNDELCVLGYLN